MGMVKQDVTKLHVLNTVLLRAISRNLKMFQLANSFKHCPHHKIKITYKHTVVILFLETDNELPHNTIFLLLNRSPFPDEQICTCSLLSVTTARI